MKAIRPALIAGSERSRVSWMFGCATAANGSARTASAMRRTRRVIIMRGAAGEALACVGRAVRACCFLRQAPTPPACARAASMSFRPFRMNVLVVGGAGYIGSHCVRQLIASGHRPVVLDNFVYGHRGAVHRDVKVYDGNLGD